MLTLGITIVVLYLMVEAQDQRKEDQQRWAERDAHFQQAFRGDREPYWPPREGLRGKRKQLGQGGQLI